MWPFRRKGGPRPSAEALTALREAEEGRDYFDAEAGPVEELIHKLRIQRIENHIGPAVADAFTRKRRPRA